MLRFPKRYLLAIPLLYLLYFFGLTNAGLVGPDEPRYAAIARQMAESGDWITPRLWGEPWFEKPALLYWMEGAAFRLGLRQPCFWGSVGSRKESVSCCRRVRRCSVRL